MPYKGSVLAVCLFGWFWFAIWIQLSLFNFFASGWKRKTNEPKRLKNSFFYDKLDYCWFSHEVIKNSHWRKFDAPEFFLSWSIRAAENEYSNQFLLRKGSSLFCDHSEPEFLSFCVMRHSNWRRWELSRTRRLKKWLIWGEGEGFCYVNSCHTLEKVLL